MPVKLKDRVDWGSFALLSGGVWAVCALLLVLIGPSLPMAATTGLVGLATLAFALASVRQGRRRESKVSSELTALSERLLRMEERANALREDSGLRAGAAQASLASDVELLGRLVGDLAESLGGHELQLQALRERRTEMPAAVPTPVPAAVRAPDHVSPSILDLDLTSREDFARTAAAILKKLAPGAAAHETVSPAPSEADVAGENAVLAALDAGRVELHLQAIVTLPQRRTRFFEAQPRLRIADGDEASALRPAAEVMPILRRHGRASDFDRQALARVFAIARHLAGREGGAAIVCPIAPDLLRSADARAETARLFASEPEAARRVMLSIQQHHYASLDANEHEALTQLVSLGPEIALTEVTDLSADWDGLARRGIVVARIGCGLLLDPPNRGELRGGLRALARAEIRIVAGGVDRESDVPDLIELDIPLAQGEALGTPRSIRADPAASPAPATAPDPPAPSEPAPERRPSFRDMLRRAG
ncbi:EAL domain-containing protein [uncultured Enterovirga sp.]|uniref:EAL domain-containing protein n=1 Tax=uncultured Enterovirga sp. TaxID=2026352 RepID=UPI0035CA88E4